MRSPAARAIRRLGLVLLLLSVPRGGAAWGWTAHELMTAAAVDGVPPALRRLYEPHREFLARHSVDPDRWRSSEEGGGALGVSVCDRATGFSELEGAEAPRHFINADAIARYPFDRLPEDFEAYRRLAGDALDSWGYLPWVSARYAELLSVELARGNNLRAVLCYSAVLAHYVEDSSEPLHLTENYDGQLSGLDGLHGRFETDLVGYHESALAAALRAAVSAAEPLADARTAAFEMLVEGYPYVDDLLRADLRAQRAAPLGADADAAVDPAYMKELWREAGDLATERMIYGVAKVASYWTWAWMRAGRPDLRDLATRDPGR